MRLKLLVVACAAACAAFPASTAVADPPDGDSDFEIIRANDEVPGNETPGSGPSEPGPVCTSNPAAYSRTGTFVQGDYRINYIDGTAYRISLSTGQVWARMYRTCTYPDGHVDNQYLWVTISDPDPRVLIEGTVDDVTRQVFAPRPALSPVTRGVVNLGMWLAVEPQVPVTALASASDTTWAQTTATMRDTTFDFGNGDSITCAGAGDPIPPSAKESIEPSPICGYTYRDTNGGEPFQLTITSTWSVVSTTSTGLVEVQPDIVLSTTVDYPVVEIQTVGASG
jgi:hypothetical protein